MSASVILSNPKYAHNVAAAIRACSCFGVANLIWTGSRVNSDEYTRLPREERMKGYKDVTWQRNDRPFDLLTGVPICIELTQGSTNLVDLEHPQDGIYLFGPQDGSVPQVLRRFCHRFVYIPAHHCLNLSAALNVVLYDRRAKEVQLTLAEVLHETRGEIAVPGWEGK